MNILIESYGCTLNKGEAEEMIEALSAAGQQITPNPDGDFDTAIIYTCGVIEATELKMLKRIGELAAGGKRVVVCGCLGAICESKILKVAPEAEIYTPERHSEALCKFSEGAETRPAQSRDSVGILPIASGCLGSCTYCITKSARGNLRSREMASIKGRAGMLIEAGVSELRVTAQDTGVYGRDIGTGLPTLLKGLASIDGHHMFRVGMMTPNSARDMLADVIPAFESPRIFKFLHLPVQSGSDRILTSMGRLYTVADFEEVLGAFRARIPEMVISTDIIVGFPGEAEADFEKSLSLIKKTGPDIVNLTRFSPRPGTPASIMKGQVPGWTAKERSRQLTELRFQISQSKFSDYIGKKTKALSTEYRKPGTTFFRTPEYRPVIVEGRAPLGEWTELEITGFAPTHLFGEPTKTK